MTIKSNAQLARAATNLGIGVAGLFIIRLFVQGLPMFREAGWLVKDKLTIMAAALIVVDAILISVLIGFAAQLKAYLGRRFAEVPDLGAMAASLIVLLCAGIAYTDFKPLTRAWPSIKDVYLWAFFILAVVLLIQVVVLLYKNKDRIAALILHHSIPAAPDSEASRSADELVSSR